MCRLTAFKWYKRYSDLPLPPFLKWGSRKACTELQASNEGWRGGWILTAGQSADIPHEIQKFPSCNNRIIVSEATHQNKV